MVTTLAGNGAGMQRHAAVARAARRLAAVSICGRQRRGGDGKQRADDRHGRGVLLAANLPSVAFPHITCDLDAWQASERRLIYKRTVLGSDPFDQMLKMIHIP